MFFERITNLGAILYLYGRFFVCEMYKLLCRTRYIKHTTLRKFLFIFQYENRSYENKIIYLERVYGSYKFNSCASKYICVQNAVVCI